MALYKSELSITTYDDDDVGGGDESDDDNYKNNFSNTSQIYALLYSINLILFKMDFLLLSW